MDIISNQILDPLLLDAVARAALGQATSGVSTGADSRIHLLNSNAPEQQRASDALNSFGTLDVTASTAALQEGEADPIISCQDDQIAADAQLAYLALRDGEETGRGRLDVRAGKATFVLRRPVAGAYTLLIYRLAGNFASGAVQIQVNAA